MMKDVTMRPWLFNISIAMPPWTVDDCSGATGRGTLCAPCLWRRPKISRHGLALRDIHVLVHTVPSILQVNAIDIAYSCIYICVYTYMC